VDSVEGASAEQATRSNNPVPAHPNAILVPSILIFSISSRPLGTS
jgi:hypothetical protein